MDNIGNIIGIYQYNGDKWVKIAIGSANSDNSGGTLTSTAENVKIVTLEWDVIDAKAAYSVFKDDL